MDYKSLGINDVNLDKCWGISWNKGIGKQCPFNKIEGNYCKRHKSIDCRPCGDIYNVVENPLLKKTKEPHIWNVNKNSDNDSVSSDNNSINDSVISDDNSVSSDNSNSIDEMLSEESNNVCDNIDVEISEGDNNQDDNIEDNNEDNKDSDVNDECDNNEGNDDCDKKEVENVLDSIISNIENDDKEKKDLINKFKNINKENDIVEEINKCVNGDNKCLENISDIELLNNILSITKKNNISYLAKKLNVAIGTIQRWIDNKKVPHSYQFDIIKLTDNSIDYSKFSYKEKDQFFTPSNISKYCFNKFKSIMEKYDINLDEYIYIEPSAGDGSFTKILPDNSINLDIEPRYDKILKYDFLEWFPPKNNKKYITIGNPPFGLRGNLALRFINHSSLFSEHVCFLLPPLFESDGRGSPMKRIQKYNLIYSETINTDFYDPSGKDIKVNVVMQIWSKTLINSEYIIKNIENNLFKIYSLSDGGTSGSTRNKNMIDKCDIYIPSTCFGKENMKVYDNFEDLPKMRGYGVVFNNKKDIYIEKSKNIDWTNISFLSTNSAYNLRMSKISDALLTIE